MPPGDIPEEITGQENPILQLAEGSVCCAMAHQQQYKIPCLAVIRLCIK